MKSYFLAAFAAAMVCLLGHPARGADDKDPKAILDKAIKALGGEENLAKSKAVALKARGKFYYGGTGNDFTAQYTLAGMDHFRWTFSSQFSGNKFEMVTVSNGDKGWRSFMGGVGELDADALTNEKRIVYLQVLPMTIVPLLGKGFNLEAAGEEKVNGKPAVGVKVKPPDGKEFTIFFDKESGLPLKAVGKVIDFLGNESDQETMFDGYRDFGGIKKATKTETKRGGESFLDSEITDFKVLDKVDPKTFTKPE